MLKFTLFGVISIALQTSGQYQRQPGYPPNCYPPPPHCQPSPSKRDPYPTPYPAYGSAPDMSPYARTIHPVPSRNKDHDDYNPPDTAQQPPNPHNEHQQPIPPYNQPNTHSNQYPYQSPNPFGNQPYESSNQYPKDQNPADNTDPSPSDSPSRSGRSRLLSTMIRPISGLFTNIGAAAGDMADSF